MNFLILVAKLLSCLLVLNLINCDSKHVIVKRRARVNVRAPEWWNEWWGKYIRDAIDPTIRPLLPDSNSLDYDVQRPETDEEFRQLQGPSTRRPSLPGPRPTFSQTIDQQGPAQVDDTRFREPSLPSPPRQPSRRPTPLRPQPGPINFPRPDDTTVNTPFEEPEKPVSIPSPPSPLPPRARPLPTPSRPGGNVGPSRPQQPQSQFQPQRPQQPQFQPQQPRQPQRPQPQFQPQPQRPQQQPVPTLRPIDQNELRPSQPPTQTFIRPSDNRQRPTLRPQSQEFRPQPGSQSSIDTGVKGGSRPRPTQPSRFPQPGSSPRPTFAPLPTFNQTPSPFRPQPISPSPLPSPPSLPSQSLKPLPVPGFEARPSKTPSGRPSFIPTQPSPDQPDIEPEVDSEEPELNEPSSTVRPTFRPAAISPRPAPPSRPVPQLTQQPSRPTQPPPVKGRPTFVNGGRNNVPQPTFRPTVRPSSEITTTVAPQPNQTFRPRPDVTFAPRPAVTFAPRPAVTFAPRPVNTFAPRPTVTFAPQVIQDTTRTPVQPRPNQLPEIRQTPGSGLRQPTERPATKGGRRPQQPSVPFQPRPTTTTPAPFRDFQTTRPRPTPSRPDIIFDTDEPEEGIDQETPAPVRPTLSPVRPTLSPVRPTLPPVRPTSPPARPTLPPRRPQSSLSPRPSFPQRPAPRPISTQAPQVEEDQDQDDQQIDQEQPTTARPVTIPSRPSIPVRPTPAPARPFFQPTFRPSTSTTEQPDEQDEDEQPEQPEQPEEPQSFGQRIPRPRPSFTPTTTTTPAAPRQPGGVKLPPTLSPRPQPGGQTSFREPIPFRPRPIQTTTQPSFTQQENDTEPEEEAVSRQPQTPRPFRPQPTQGPVTLRPQQPIETVSTVRPPVKTPIRPTPGQTIRPFPPATFRPRPIFTTTLAPTTTVSPISTSQTFDDDYEDTQGPVEPSQRPQEVVTNQPRPQQPGFTNPPPRPSRPSPPPPPTTSRPSLVPSVPIRITTDRPQPVAPVDQSTDYEDGQNEQEITIPDFQPTRRPSSPRVPSLPESQVKTTPDQPAQVQPQRSQQPEQPQQPQLPLPSRPQLPIPSRPQQPRDEPEPRPRPQLPALPGPKRPTSPQAPVGKRPIGKTPNTGAVVYNPPLGPAISVDRPDRPKPDGSMPDCTLLGSNYCILTNDYPMDGINEVVNRSYSRIKLMYEELQTVGDPDLFKSHVGDSLAAKGQFACETESHMMKPGWAKDEITKEWMIIVNTDIFPQQVRTESCKRPNEPCSFVAPYYESTCQQRYSLHRLIAVDPHDPGKSPVVALFKFPAGCACRVHPVRISQTGEKAKSRK